MRNQILALVTIGMIQFSANAQSKEAKKSAFDINYKVCRIDNKAYKTCSDNTPAVVYTKSYAKKLERNENQNQKTVDGLRKYDTYLRVQPLPAVVVTAPRYWGYTGAPGYSGTAAAARHLPMAENDGYQKIQERNLNYMNTSVVLPPSDGGLSERK